MKKILLAASALALCACIHKTQSVVERTVTVHRDAQGHILAVDEVEHVTQVGNKRGVPIRYVYEAVPTPTPPNAVSSR